MKNPSSALASLITVFLAHCLTTSHGFAGITTAATRSKRRQSATPPSRHSETSTSLQLIPIAQFRDELTFFDQPDSHRCCIDGQGRLILDNDGDNSSDEKPFELCIVEEEDLPEVTLFIIKAFGADAINLSSNEFSEFEKGLLEPALGFFNGYAAISAFAEVLWGLRLRLNDRVLMGSLMGNEGEEKPPVINDISPPNLHGSSSNKEKNKAASQKSLVLVLARRNAEMGTNSSKWTSVDSDIDVIASVELQLQPSDGKIPFSLPWWDRIERNIANFLGYPRDSSAKILQPYLSSLCVDEQYRGKKIGRAMVRCLEDIVMSRWGYSKLYLHVDGDNPPALNLYKSEGYKDVGLRWNPFWAGKGELGLCRFGLTD